MIFKYIQCVPVRESALDTHGGIRRLCLDLCTLPDARSEVVGEGAVRRRLPTST